MGLVILGEKLRWPHHTSLVSAGRILVIELRCHELLVIHRHLMLMCNISVAIFGNWAN